MAPFGGFTFEILRILDPVKIVTSLGTPLELYREKLKKKYMFRNRKKARKFSCRCRT